MKAGVKNVFGKNKTNTSSLAGYNKFLNPDSLECAHDRKSL
jgi:hypothetical protein